MTLKDLRYLVALVDHGHFGRAAEACHVSQPTLSTQLKKLEEQLGVTLFERTNRAVRVTTQGEEIVARARRILADVEAIVEVGRRGAAPLSGAFGLGVIPTLGPYLLPWLAPALAEDHPHLRLSVIEDQTACLLERLIAHRLDAALIALPVSDAGIATLPLFDEPFWYAEPAGGTAAAADIVTGDDLRGQKLLLLTEGHCLRDQSLALCRTSERDAPMDFRATSLEFICEMVAMGIGSTLLPAMACDAARARSVVTRPLADGIGRRIGLVWRASYPKVGDLHLLARTLLDNLPKSVRRV